MSEVIWTHDVRSVLYNQLLRRFGPFEQWEKFSSPGRGFDAGFERFCEVFAETIGAESAKAVKHQIAFALPERGNGSTWEAPMARTAILNKAAALEAGFIRQKHLPDLLAVYAG